MLFYNTSEGFPRYQVNTFTSVLYLDGCMSYLGVALTATFNAGVLTDIADYND